MEIAFAITISFSTARASFSISSWRAYDIRYENSTTVEQDRMGTRKTTKRYHEFHVCLVQEFRQPF